MKFAFTLFTFLFAALSLSASTHLSDTTKLLAAVQKSDISKTLPDSAAIITAAIENFHTYYSKTNRADSLKANVFESYQHLELKISSGSNNNADLKASLFTNNSEDKLFFSEVNHKDSRKLIDSLNLATANYLDSLNTSIALRKRIDSLKQMEAVYVDSLKKKIKSMGLDSLKHQVKINKFQTLKGALYSEIASRYLKFDTISNADQREDYENEALRYTMLALHQYSSFNDTSGLRISFDGLAKAYMAQQKYSQAKWFILQSNTLSRAKNDVPNIIASLLTLSAIKSEIKDYALAMRDLNEALQLSEVNHYQKTELEVLKSYAMLYSRLKNYPKETLMIKKRDSLAESIHKDEQLKLMASLRAQALLQKKKLDSLQKKKVYTSNTKKLYKNNSTRKIASL